MKKKLALLILAIAFLSGCAFFQNQKANWEACLQDTACHDNAVVWKEKGETVGVIVGGTVGSFVPGAAGVASEVGKQGFGWLSFALAMLIGGAAITKKKQQEKK